MSIFDIFDQINKSKAPEPTGPVEYIIAGLGNPGAQYESTRHNAGFMTVDTLAAKHGFEIKRLKFKSLTADTVIEGKTIRCVDGPDDCGKFYMAEDKKVCVDTPKNC